MNLFQYLKRICRAIFVQIAVWELLRRDLQRRLAIHAHRLNEAELTDFDPWRTRSDIDPAVAL